VLARGGTGGADRGEVDPGAGAIPRPGPAHAHPRGARGEEAAEANRIANPGFEAGMANWGVWVREGTTCEHKIDDQVAHAGKQSAWIGPGTVACYTYSVKVQPGEAFYIGCWARRATPHGVCALKVWWQSPEGKNLPAIPQWEKRLGGAVGQWQKLEMYGEVPQTAGLAMVLLVGQDFTAGDGCWFDDVQCFTIKMD